jgi:hypothetical protein
MMRHAERDQIRHRVVAAQPRRRDVVDAESIGPTTDHAGVPVTTPHRRPRPLPLRAAELGAAGTVTPSHQLEGGGVYGSPCLLAAPAVLSIQKR